jgi:uncharacterized protein (TIGR02246 family)
MRKWLLIAALGCNALWALEPADQQAIEGIVSGYVQSWNERACQGFGDGFADDADFVNIFGMIFSGREEIEARHVQIMQSFLKDSRLSIIDTKLREVQPGLVIAIIRWSLANNPKIKEGVFTQVFVNSNGRWEITASQNTLKGF